MFKTMIMHSPTRQMPSIRIIGVLVATLAMLSACDPNRPNRELSNRLEQDGYSFLPPVEPGWLIANRATNSVALVKSGQVEGQSFVVEATPLALDSVDDVSALVEFAKRTQQQDLPRPRFRFQMHDVSEIQIAGANCALSHILAEDRNPETGSNVATAMLIETVGTICAHPSRPGTGVALMYTHRSFPEDRDRGFEANAMRVLQTQLFNDATRQAN